MDEFLREIHTSIFKEWILLQPHDDYKILLDPKNDNIILIQTEYSQSQITFNNMSIIELNVVNTFTNEIDFYLHFQMKTMKHAVELFNEMLDCIKKLVKKPTIRILLSCSGGLTTSFFALKMNEASELLSLNYEVSAIGYNELFNKGNEYDVILLAPQISYMHAKVQQILKEQVVIKIPPQVFAKYDVAKVISLIQEAMENHQAVDEEVSMFHPLPLKEAVSHISQPILTLSVFRNSSRVHIAYRLYLPHHQISLDNEIIKSTMDVQDIYDVIDTVLVQYPQLKTIGISIPGIINDGWVASAHVNGLEDLNLLEILNQRYHQHFIICNDVNTAAVGYYASQNKYSSLTVLFQPTSFYAGAGTIINGQLITGKSHLAGEVQYLPMNLSDSQLVLNKTPEGALELVSKTILSIISVINPDIFVLFCTVIPDIEELKKEIAKYIPQEYLPEIIKQDDLKEYTLLGQLILCIQSL